MEKKTLDFYDDTFDNYIDQYKDDSEKVRLRPYLCLQKTSLRFMHFPQKTTLCFMHFLYIIVNYVNLR